MTDRELASSAYNMCLRGEGDPPFDGIEVNYAENLVYAAQKVRETGVVVSAFDQCVALVLNNPPYAIREYIAPDEPVAEVVAEEAVEEVVEAPKPKKRTKAKPAPVYKSAKTGKIVTEAYALRNPDTTFAT